jgi:hypothetical protein
LTDWWLVVVVVGVVELIAVVVMVWTGLTVAGEIAVVMTRRAVLVMGTGRMVAA